MTRYREGDVVLVEATVRYDFDSTDDKHVIGADGAPRISLRVNYNDFTAPVSEVRLLRPFFKKGERIIHKGPSYEIPKSGEILAVNGDSAWVMIDGEAMPSTMPVKSLMIEETKLPPPASPET